MENNYSDKFSGPLTTSLTDIGELDNENDDVEVNKDEIEVPFYEKALQSLFGKETADRFVHPKIDESIGVAGMTATLRSQRIINVVDRHRYKEDSALSLEKIQTNAERLWSMLRENSSYNIKKEDSKIDPKLKGSFNAFARGFIGRNMTPPQRSFVEDDELLEMRRRMKNDIVSKFDLSNRKKRLMFNLSELQEGNQAMLLREKSLLTVNEPGIKELYFPPIMKFQELLSSEVKKSKNKKSYHQMLSDLDVDVVNEEALFYDNTKEPLNLRFFTENDSLKILQENNIFRDKVQQKVGHGDNVMEQMIDKSRRQAMDDDDRSKEKISYLKTIKRSRPPPQSPSSFQDDTQKTPWVPLTLGAVMDFQVTRKPTFAIDDDSQFRQGACRLWRPKLAVA